MLNFDAGGDRFTVAYGSTVGEVLDLVYNSTGKRGRFRRVGDGRDLLGKDVLRSEESYEFIPHKEVVETSVESMPAKRRCVRPNGTESISTQEVVAFYHSALMITSYCSERIAQAFTPFAADTTRQKECYADLTFLDKLLRSNIPVKIPFLPPKRAVSMFMDDSKESLFCESEDEEAAELISLLRYFEGAVYSMKTGSSTTTIMKCITCITGELWRTMQLVGRNSVSVEYAYNSSDGYRGPETRPDETVYFNNFLMFRGEHSLENIPAVTKKLLANFPDYSEMEYGPWIRYLPAYVANREMIRFFLVDVRTKKLHPIGFFNFEYLMDRQSAVKLSLNIYRLLLTLASLCPTNVPPLYKEVHEVIFFANYVFKSLPPKQPHAPDEVYALLQDGRIPCAIRVEKREQSLLIRPKGMIISAGGSGVSPQELMPAIKSVLKCLQSLHSFGFVHRDVRWNNVIKFQGSTDGPCEFIVIDFELAAKSGGRMPLFKYVFEDVVGYDQPFHYHHDLICMSKMIDFVAFQGSNPTLSPPLQAVRDYLASATEDSSASQALDLLESMA